MKCIDRFVLLGLACRRDPLFGFKDAALGLLTLS